MLMLPSHVSSLTFCQPPISSLPFKPSLNISLNIICLYLLPSFSWTVLICVSLVCSQNLQGHRLSAAILGPSLGFLYSGSIPCFSSSSSILSASVPALALPRSFNPSSSGSAAIKEAHFTRARYRSVSHRTRRSLCSAAKAFKTVCVQQQGRQSRIVKEAM